MDHALIAACAVLGGYKLIGAIYDWNMKKEIRWQRFEIEGAQLYLNHVISDPAIPAEIPLKTNAEMQQRLQLIADLYKWLEQPLWDRLNTEIPRNNLCDYI